jgi:hypothetical protein
MGGDAFGSARSCAWHLARKDTRYGDLQRLLAKKSFVRGPFVDATNASVYFLASSGAGGVSIFQVSRNNCHLPSFLRITESHLPVSTTVPFTITLR